jgi:ABC-type Mn2+/Zn2+ transport system ATPase subunit
VIASHHDLDTVRDIYDEVLLLNRKPLAFGPVAEVFTGEQIEKTFAAGVAGGKERA